MPTWTALTHAQGRAAADALCIHAEETLTIEPVGSGVFEIEDGSNRWEVGLYFTESPDEIALALLAAAHDAQPFVISQLPEIDWVVHVRRELTPVRAGRFFLYGSHDHDKVPDGVEALSIEAAMAFGTGHHNTTKGCLEALERLVVQGFYPNRVADIGCGTAVLAMAAARIWPGIVLASDIDPVAVDTARANVLANGLKGRVETAEAAGFDHPILDKAAPFDLIFANILMQPLLDLASAMARYTVSGGKVIMSGILEGQADRVIGTYQQAGFTLTQYDHRDEWSTLTMTRQ